MRFAPPACIRICWIPIRQNLLHLYCKTLSVSEWEYELGDIGISGQLLGPLHGIFRLGEDHECDDVSADLYREFFETRPACIFRDMARRGTIASLISSRPC